MKDFLKNKQKWIVGLVILGLMFVAGGFGVASYLYGNRCYRGYEVKNKVNRSDSNNVNYRYHNGNILAAVVLVRLITKGKVCGMAVMK